MLLALMSYLEYPVHIFSSYFKSVHSLIVALPGDSLQWSESRRNVDSAYECGRLLQVVSLKNGPLKTAAAGFNGSMKHCISISISFQ